jgi:cyclopropane fatty-acyl-phospholipid synthase-like methyltransferase
MPQEEYGRYRKHYDDDQAARYAKSKLANRRVHDAECRLAARALAGVDRNETIMDAPCGAGRMTVFLAELGFRPAAADVSPAMVELAGQRCADEGLEVPVEVADLESTGWPDDAYDNLFSFRFFHHLPTLELQRRVAVEMCRVTRRRVLVSYLDARSWTSRRRALEARLKHRIPGKHTLTPPQMTGLFETAGFKVVADYARLPLIHSLRILVAERR